MSPQPPLAPGAAPAPGAPAAPGAGGLAEALPALFFIGSLVTVIGAALALVGLSDVDIPSLVRGAPVRTFLGASLLLLAVMTVGVGFVFPDAGPRLTRAAYAAAAAGLILYVLAAVHVTSDPAAPVIAIGRNAATDETSVSATASHLSFNERLLVSASFADEQGLPFARRVLGPDDAGKVDAELTVPAPGPERRLQITASVLDKNNIRRDFECNAPKSGRTCAEAAATIPGGTPEVRTRLHRGVLDVTILDRRRIPGVLALQITRRSNVIFATRTRVSKTALRLHLRLGARPLKKVSDTVCIAATYGPDAPTCAGSAASGAVTRLYPSARQLRP